MTLNIIGIGLNDEKDITLRGLDAITNSKKVYLENYTSLMSCKKKDLEKFYGKRVIAANRELVEKHSKLIINQAAKDNISFLVVGDPLSATTHLDLFLSAIKKGVNVQIIHNTSIMTAIGEVGLDLYKYGKTTSIVFPQDDWAVETHYDVIKQNQERGLHTLCLLDIKIREPKKEELRKERANSFEKPRFMTINQAISDLLRIEKKRKENVFTEETSCVGCSRIGSPDKKIVFGRAKDLLNKEFGRPLHCLIIPGSLHFMEEEALQLWKV